MNHTQYYGTGTRKTSVARVYLRPGNGGFQINARPIDEYFPNPMLKMLARQPLVLAELGDKFDILALVKGGGISGQAGAIRMGISRALLEFNLDLRGALKKEGFLTRDARKKERKKYGQRGARARFQFSKR